MNRKDLIHVATNHIGVTESPAGSNRVEYNDWYYPENHKYHNCTDEFSGKNFPWC